ncbi:50S ribosomal protein L17 [bacterium]|nr:50S ribosomal protein L17 [bacterium]
MRHRKNVVKLGRTAAHRKALMRNLLDSLILNSRMETTVVKAKELKRYADNFFSRVRKNDLPAKKRAIKFLRTKEAFLKLFTDDFIDFLNSRNGGYVRVIRTGIRAGDAAPLAIIELTGKYEPKKKEKAPHVETKKVQPKEVKKEEVKAEKEEAVEATAAVSAEEKVEAQPVVEKTEEKPAEKVEQQTPVVEAKVGAPVEEKKEAVSKPEDTPVSAESSEQAPAEEKKEEQPSEPAPEDKKE